jgi:hypothetical protein
MFSFALSKAYSALGNNRKMPEFETTCKEAVKICFRILFLLTRRCSENLCGKVGKLGKLRYIWELNVTRSS